MNMRLLTMTFYGLCSCVNLVAGRPIQGCGLESKMVGVCVLHVRMKITCLARDHAMY
jgi:hypothetical protein